MIPKNYLKTTLGFTWVMGYLRYGLFKIWAIKSLHMGYIRVALNVRYKLPRDLTKLLGILKGYLVGYLKSYIRSMNQC
jgi:hypothetical protein